LKTLSQNPDESSSHLGDQKSGIDWTNIFTLLWQSRKFIGKVTGAVTVLAIILSFLLPKSFKSTAILLPDTEKSKLPSASGGISDLAAMAGITVGGEGSVVKLYPTILKSESVLRAVIYAKYRTKEYPDSVNLIRYWDIKEENLERDFEVALLALRTNMEINLDLKTAVLTMSIESEEPQLSADILNNTIIAADKFIRTKRNTNASEQRKWIEARLVEVKEDLARSENTLKNFREKNRMVSGSPQLLLDQERLVREMQINSALYTELKKQYELVKIEEIRTTPIINVMDYARPAAKKEHPKRTIIVLAAMMLAFAGSSGYRIIEHKHGKKIQGWYESFRRMKS